MAEPSWISVIAMLTGIAGLIMGFVSLRKVNRMKSLDLRLELRKAETAVRASLSNLESNMAEAKLSRERVYAATGRFKSGAMETWHAHHETDRSVALGLLSELPSLVDDCFSLSPEDLESRIVAVHGLQLTIASLNEFYQASLSSDDEERRQIRNDVRNAFK